MDAVRSLRTRTAARQRVSKETDDSRSSNGPAESSEGTALVVDDDAATRRLVAKWFMRGNLRCLEATDGEHGLAILREAHERIDVVILDMMMPGLTGLEVLALIQQDAALSQVPVILLTAHANSERDFIEAAETGATDHLAKPFSGAVLQAKALRAARARRAARDRLAEAELRARIDPLTQLGNRQLLFERLREESSFANRYHASLCVCILDIDHFKSINDRFGHDTGDVALKLFARMLAASIRKEDAAFRYGGEEFVLLLRQNAEADARVLLGRVRDALALFPLALPGGGAEVLSFSGGIAVADGSNEFLTDGMIRRADHALYAAKRAGRSRDCVATSTDEVA